MNRTSAAVALLAALGLTGCAASGPSDITLQASAITRCDQTAAQVFAYTHDSDVLATEFGARSRPSATSTRPP